MPSPQKKKSSAAVFIYKDMKTGELYQYSRKGIYKKNGRTLVFIKKSKGETMSDHILNRAAESYADDKAGYPPNCNEGYVAKDGKCVPVQEEDAGKMYKKKADKKDKKKNGDDEEKDGKDKNKWMKH
jgi:hypothetical protein